jgi:Etoposide-induced protein 2.4 (EI24)
MNPPDALGSQGAAVLASLGRALLSCLHPRVIFLTALPLLITAVGMAVAAWLWWGPATRLIEQTLGNWGWLGVLIHWLQGLLGQATGQGTPPAGASDLARVLAPIVLLMLAVPLVVMGSLVVVAAFLSPSLVRWVAASRFPQLLSLHQAGWWSSVGWSLKVTLQAVLLLVLTLPLWLVPILGALVAPMIWGWMTCRVMAHDALAEHALPQEREALLHEHRWALLAIGMAAGGLGAAPSHVLVMGVMALGLVGGLAGGAVMGPMGSLAAASAPLLMGVSVWFYTLVFAFSSLWFTHYLLTALSRSRLKAVPQASSLTHNAAL